MMEHMLLAETHSVHQRDQLRLAGVVKVRQVPPPVWPSLGLRASDPRLGNLFAHLASLRGPSRDAGEAATMTSDGGHAPGGRFRPGPTSDAPTPSTHNAVKMRKLARMVVSN
jgi:hypothetical protein